MALPDRSHQWLAVGRNALTAAMDVVFPPRCLACRAGVSVQGAEDGRFCAACAVSIERERGSASCPTCAATVAHHEVRDGRCGECRNTRPKVLRLARVGSYQGLLGEMLRQYKYNHREELLPVLGEWLVRAIEVADWLSRVEAVTCVPTHWRRQIRTRLYPAAELARYAARRVGLPYVSVLRRVRAGPHQVGLSYADRLENIVNAFAMRRGVELRETRLLVIDDVRTTGATLNECAKVLRRAGAAEIYGAVVVRGKPQHIRATVGGP